MTNRETDGDIHGERAAEIHRLVGELRTQLEKLVTFSDALCKAKEWEGGIVRYFRRPDIDGLTDCHLCGATMRGHGWLDDGGNGQIVCPGDFIVTTDGRHAVVQQPARAESTSRRQ